MNINALKLKEEGSMISLEQLHKIRDYMESQKLTHLKLNFLILVPLETRFLPQDELTRKREVERIIGFQNNAESNPLFPPVRRELSNIFRIAGWSYTHFNVYKNDPVFSYRLIQKSVNEQVAMNKLMKMHTLYIITDANLLNFVEINNVNYILI